MEVSSSNPVIVLFSILFIYVFIIDTIVLNIIHNQLQIILNVE